VGQAFLPVNAVGDAVAVAVPWHARLARAPFGSVEAGTANGERPTGETPVAREGRRVIDRTND